MTRRPLHVRVTRALFWAAVFSLTALIAVLLLAFLAWLLVVDWHVLGL